MINFKLLHDILTIMIIFWGYIFQSVYNKICRIYNIATWHVAHISLIFQILRDQQGMLLIPSATGCGKEALIDTLSLLICILDIIYDFCYVLPLVIAVVCICFMLQFSMLLCQVVLFLNKSTVYYLFKQSWQDDIFFLSSATYHKPFLCSWKRPFEMWELAGNGTLSSLFF